MKVISVSRRTDIPAFYTPWFMNRLREGFAQAPNPYNPRQLSSLGLRPHQVACLVFWTKDPRPMLPRLADLDAQGYRYYFQVTVTGLPVPFEPAVPDPREVCLAMRQIAERIGSKRVIWRFDPILCSDQTPPERILATFEHLARTLRGTTGQVMISLARPYRQSPGALATGPFDQQMKMVDWDRLRPARAHEKLAPLIRPLVDIARGNGMQVFSCAEKIDLSSFGVTAGQCIDGSLIHELFGLRLNNVKDRGQRAECRCIPSLDIGAYGTCPHGCSYCYAGTDRALRAGQRHDPQGPMLIGSPEAVEQPQLSLF